MVMKFTVEIMVCPNRDSLGYVHSCHHPASKFALCEANLHFGKCPRSMVAVFQEDPPKCLCAECKMTEQMCRHKKTGPSKETTEKK